MDDVDSVSNDQEEGYGNNKEELVLAYAKDDVYRPQMMDLMDLKEGFRDSDKSREPLPTGVPAGVQGCQMGSGGRPSDEFPTTTTERTGFGSRGKRKRAEGGCRQRKTQGGPSADEDQSALSRIDSVMESREQRYKGKGKNEDMGVTSVHDCINILYTLEECRDDEDFRMKCLNLVEAPQIRTKIMRLNDHSTRYLVDYLQKRAENPPEWLKRYL